MRIPVIAFLFCCGLATFAVAQDETTTIAKEAPKDSPLVAASKKATPRKKTPKKVITNADVKKSKGKLVVLQPRAPLPGENQIGVVDPRGSLQKQDDELREKRSADEAVTAAEKRVADLDKELNRIEQSFYDENDATYRDNVIQKRFDQAKRQLDDARQDLANARDKVSALAKK